MADEDKPYDTKWLRELASDHLHKYPIGTAFEMIGKAILEKLGFKNIRKLRDYDLYAEKDGKTYAIEVKGTSVDMSLSIPWDQIKELFRQQDNVNYPLFMFINSKGEWSVYQIFDGWMSNEE